MELMAFAKTYLNNFADNFISIYLKLKNTKIMEITKGLFERLFNDGIELVTSLKCNMKNKLMQLYD